MQGRKWLQRKKPSNQQKRWWRGLGGMMPIEWNYPHLSGFNFDMVLLFKAYLFIPLPQGYSKLDLITMYLRAQQIAVWAHGRHVKFFTADHVGVPAFGVQRKFSNCWWGMQPLLSRKSTLHLMSRLFSYKVLFEKSLKIFLCISSYFKFHYTGKDFSFKLERLKM